MVKKPPNTFLTRLINNNIDQLNSLTITLRSKQLDKITVDKVKLDNGYLLKETVEQYWEDFGWDNQYKHINYYDESNNLIRGELQTWRSDSIWQTYFRAFYTYDQVVFLKNHSNTKNPRRPTE